MAADFRLINFLDLLPLCSSPESTTTFLQDVLQEIMVYLKDTNDRTKNVLEFIHPREMKEMNDFTISLRDDNPATLDQIVSDIRNTLKWGVKTGMSM